MAREVVKSQMGNTSLQCKINMKHHGITVEFDMPIYANIL